MNFNFTDKVVVITGATGGIGLALAKAFAEAGAKLALIGRREGMEDLFKKEFNPETDFCSIRAELSKEEDIDFIMSRTIEKFGQIDVLINCAGMNIRKKLKEYTSEDWDMVQNVNTRSIFLLSQKVAQIMKDKKYGKIINISSMQSVICWPSNGRFSLAPYCASKAALNSLTKSFALDLARYNINVNAVCPAVVDGKWAESLKNEKGLYDDIIMRTPMKRLCRHEDLIGPVMLFASDYGGYITGQCLLVDGGWTIE